MTDTFRALCAELINELHGYKVAHQNHSTELIELARAALAKAEDPDVFAPPSDGEVADLPEGYIGPETKKPTDVDIDALVYDCLEEDGYSIRAVVRAALARWGTPAPAPPSDGEVAELVAWLRETGDTIQPSHLAEHQRYKRAAELLERQVLVPPPADGEVAELVAELQSMATDADKRCRFSNAERLSRAAELLQRLSPPQPEVGE